MSNLVGSILIALGLVPFLIWLGREAGLLGANGSGELSFIVMAVAMIGLGVMLRAGKGSKISEAFLSWFNRK